MVCDAMMPGLDGFQVLTALRADPSTAQLPVIMLSARAGEEAAVEGLAAGADDYLVKPFSSRELIARVRANLDLAELRQAAARATERHAQLLRDLADAAVAINRAATVPAVLEVAAQRARALVDAEWTSARLEGELDGAEAAAPGPVRRVALTGSTGRALGELLLAGEFGTGGVEADAVLTQLAQVASTRLENALLYEHEHRVAETLQRSLLPETLPDLPGAELAALYLPGSSEASVGGDWYDALALGDDTVALVIGDVVGKGVKAASSMGQLRNAVRAYLLEGYGPAETLVRVNRLVDTLGGSFATLLIVLVELESGRIRYSSAGHPPALVVTPDGSTRWLDQGVVGAGGGVRRPRLPRGRGPAPARERAGALHRRARRAPRRVDRRRAGAPRRRGGRLPRARRHARGPARAGRLRRGAAGRRRRACAEPPPGRRQRRCWSGSPPRRPRSRRCATACAAGSRARASSGPSPRDLLLAAGEAASNAVEHPLAPAPAAIVLDARRTDDGYAEIAVRDHGRWNDEPSAPHRGRGMEIIQAIVGEGGDVRVDRTDGGTTISFRRRLGEEVP